MRSGSSQTESAPCGMRRPLDSAVSEPKGRLRDTVLTGSLNGRALAASCALVLLPLALALVFMSLLF
ncbi:MAG TPA: hypothetical protein DCQ06_00620 [Myxococcales bacterium]|nr:hypothetical protein [Myxococcales bacterium]HAN30075.1 hypothetical protein [Myxococcales bacterium]